MFAKQLPKLIEEIFGIKSDGMLLHPLKKFQEQALFGKEITGISKGLTRGVTAAALGTVTGAAGGLIAGQKLSNEEGVKRVLTGAGQTIRGSLRGMAGSFVGGIKSKGMIQAVGTGVGGFQRNADYVNSLDGTTLTGRMKAGLEQRLHIATDADRTKLELDELDKFIQTTDAALKRAEAESIKYNTLELKDDNGNIIITMQQHKAKQQQLIRMQNEQIDKKDSKYWVKHNGQYYFDDITYENDKIARDDEIAKLQDEISINQKKFAQAYITQVGNRKLRGNDGKLVEDGELDNYVNQMKHYQDKLAEKGHEYKIIDDDKKIIGDIKKAKQDATVKKQEIENNYNENNVNVYQQQQANAAATKPKGK